MTTSLVDSLTVQNREPGMRPEIAIITPCYGHPELMQEALYSAIDQTDAPPFRMVIVNDGCRYPRTDQVGRLLERRYPQTVRYIRTPNGGLGCARNNAVEFVLANEPSVNWLFFLDADNRLLPRFLRKAVNAIQADPDFDWYYFSRLNLGPRHRGDTSGEYSFPEQLLWNACDAGTFISRRVFEAGIRFYTDLEMGYEDWLLFLSAFAAGFRGAHIDNPGFLYRMRPDSMVADVNARKASILERMYERLGDAVCYSNLLTEEARVTPRWALLTNRADGFAEFSDPRHVTRRSDYADGVASLLNARIEDHRSHFPSHLVVAGDAAWESLAESKLLHWILWWQESKLAQGTPMAALRLKPMRSGRTGVRPASSATRPLSQWDVFFLKTDVLLESSMAQGSDWSAAIEKLGTVRTAELLVPRADLHGARVGERPAEILQRLADDLRARRKHDPVLGRFHSGLVPMADRRRSETFLREVLQCGPLYSRTRDGRRSVGLFMGSGEGGDEQRIALNTAKVLHEHGCDVHLIIARSNEADVPSEFQPYLDTVNFLDDPVVSRTEPDAAYFGTRFSSLAVRRSPRRLVGLLAHLDAVIDYQSSVIPPALGELRRRRIRTISAQPLIVHSETGLWRGSLYEAIAFEHGYDRLLVPSPGLVDWFVGRGVPREKILCTPNCPGLPLPAHFRGARRNGDPASRPLRVLFAGQLDRQTGVERLTRIVERTLAARAKIEWRVIGHNALEGLPAVASALTKLVAVEPLRPGAEVYYGAMAWADVLVLPSRGAAGPLSMLEAMATGCIVVAIGGGDIPEVLTDETGFIVSPTATVEDDFVRILLHLAENRNLVGDKSRNALRCAAALSWERSLTPLVEYLEDALVAGRRSESRLS